jgi:hypothetical protein
VEPPNRILFDFVRGGKNDKMKLKAMSALLQRGPWIALSEQAAPLFKGIFTLKPREIRGSYQFSAGIVAAPAQLGLGC